MLGKVTEEAASIPADASLVERAIYPLAIPGIAGAGAMLTVVLLTDNNTRTFAEQVSTTGILVLCLACLFVLFALARFLFRILGRSGIEIVSRVFGLILCSIAVNGLIIAIKLSFHLALEPAGRPEAVEVDHAVRLAPDADRAGQHQAAIGRLNSTCLPSSETSNLSPFRRTRSLCHSSLETGTSLLAINARRPPSMR